ncbi:ABC transporter permease [Streptomyces sp. NBC_01210]|uniref:ABC transporter permease subunit n=1 Tax=Streptomyces sp. NBC_01210 TaxID=2903774 RepID=UPI002E11CC58|nr:ABC transporter permease [Streptomyces sp. NBC_01210]
MNRPVRYEWVRLTTLTSTWLLAAAAVAVTALAAWGYAFTVTEFQSEEIAVTAQEALVAVINKASFAPLAAGVFGALAMGGDYRHGTIRATLAVTPVRSRAVAAKALVAGGFALAVTGCATAVSWIVASATLPAELISGVSYGDLIVLHGGLLLQTVCWTLIGIAITVVFRSQAVGTVSLVAIPYVLEPMVRTGGLFADSPWLAQAAKYLPFAAGTSMSNIAGDEGAFLAEASQRMAPGTAVLVFGLFTGALFVGAVAQFRRQGM